MSSGRIRQVALHCRIAPVLTGKISTALAPLFLLACQFADSTAPGSGSLVWSSVSSGTSQYWGTSPSDVWGVDVGTDGYLSKPFSPEQLHAVIETMRPLIDEQIARVDLPASAA